jgi:hypothetical protein
VPVGQAQVTDGETALIEEWKGSSWSIVPGAPASATASSLHGVSGTGPSDVWAVGDGPGGELLSSRRFSRPPLAALGCRPSFTYGTAAPYLLLTQNVYIPEL